VFTDSTAGMDYNTSIVGKYGGEKLDTLITTITGDSVAFALKTDDVEESIDIYGTRRADGFL
jgi:hypothetical protein